MADKPESHDPLKLSPEAQAALDADPALAEAVKDTFAMIRQAHWAWQSGQYPSFEDAMEAISGQRPEAVDIGEDDDDGR